MSFKIVYFHLMELPICCNVLTLSCFNILFLNPLRLQTALKALIFVHNLEYFFQFGSQWLYKADFFRLPLSLFTGNSRVGHLLLGPWDLDMDPIVRSPFICIIDFKNIYLFPSNPAVLLCSSFFSDIPPSCAPLGRSMHTMTSTSDHTLFIYGGLGIDGNTLSESHSCIWRFTIHCL